MSPVEDLSHSAQDYLKVIWGLQEWTGEGEVSPAAIARRAGVRPSTVSGAVAKLAALGLIEHAPYGGVSLTDRGRGYALTMVRRHRLLETFLVETLRYAWDEVHDEAERLEHAVSGDFVERIAAALGHPERDPHGDPIPRADGSVPRVEAVPLTEVSAGARTVVERVADDDPALLQHCSDRGLVPGARVRVLPPEPYADGVQVAVPGDGPDTPVSLGSAAAAAVWVAPVRGAHGSPGDRTP